jgi:glutamyl/glutaminyl-tRNA synthetase
LMEAMGASSIPVYAHLPLLFGPDGKKLSKRHGETALSFYRDSGFLPDAVFNYLCLLGWSVDGETTIFSRDEAVASFDLADVSKNPAIFDTDKLEWMNGEYIRSLGATEFEGLMLPHVEAALGRALEDEELETMAAMAPLIQERTKLLPEVGEQARFLFADIDEYDEKSWEKVMAKEGVADILGAATGVLASLELWNKESIENGLRGMLADMDIGVGKGLQPMRVAVTGSSISPPLFESMTALGRERTLARLEKARSLLV